MNKQPLNKFLLTRDEINQHTAYIHANNLTPHGLSCKDFDIALICPYLSDGNIVDLGSNGSWVLENTVKMNLKGLKYGIDLGYPEGGIKHADGIELFKGDLMNTPFETGLFDYVTCLSVIEHSVDFNLLAQECARLLKTGGKLFITYDYWNPKPDTSAMKLYNLDWNILDQADVFRLVDACKANGLTTGDIDFTTQEAVINPRYCSPANVSYTFGILMFEKQ